MIEQATMDPAAGVVLGVRWGAAAAACAAALGPLSATAGAHDARCRVEAPVSLAGVAWAVEAVFELDALCALVLRAAGGPAVFDGAALPRLLALASGWLGAPLARLDEGYWQGEAGSTRVTLDLLEGALTFEDADA